MCQPVHRNYESSYFNQLFEVLSHFFIPEIWKFYLSIFIILYSITAITTRIIRLRKKRELSKIGAIFCTKDMKRIERIAGIR